MAGEELLRQVFLKGKCILVRDSKKLAYFKMTAFSRIVDLAYYKNQMQTGLVRNIMGDLKKWRVDLLVDTDLILTKAGSIKRHLNRVFEKRNTDLRTFLKNIDVQESVLFNIQMAIQNCIDIAAYIISNESFGVCVADPRLCLIK